MKEPAYDAVVVGSGPNGLAAAITLARQRRSVLVLEAAPLIGGGTRSAELTLPGFVHDICSAVHPLAVASPFLRSLPLEQHGLKWIYSPAALAHPLDDQPAAVADCSLITTAASLGADQAAYQRMMAPLVEAAEGLYHDLLGPLRFPKHPIPTMRFGWRAIQSAAGLANRSFRGHAAKALLAGAAAHSALPLRRWTSAAIGLMLLTAAHAGGWPLPEGGAQSISRAMGSYFQSLGGQIVTGKRITHLSELPPARLILLDLTPRQLLELGGERFSSGYRRSLERFRYGPGVFKVDWALQRPIPWNDPACRQAATVHLGGTLEEMEASEAAAWTKQPAERPFVLLTQPTLFDATRAPAGQHTAWAYCHVPHGSTADMLPAIEAQVERFARGFGETILARHIIQPKSLELYNANYIGGDINGGVQDIWQLFTRPVARWRPYRTSATGIYMCSSSTPPGGGVHGMCGYFAAQTALQDLT